jgi:dual specificity MAP kinase phosphatase
MFNQMTMPSIFERVNPNDRPTNFTFGAERNAEVNHHDSNSDGGVNPTSTENLMDSS